MKKQKYKVLLNQVHIQEVHIEAGDKEEALTRALRGEGEYVGDSVYSCPLERTYAPFFHKVEDLVE
jgi:hypothetical protein